MITDCGRIDGPEAVSSLQRRDDVGTTQTEPDRPRLNLAEGSGGSHLGHVQAVCGLIWVRLIFQAWAGRTRVSQETWHHTGRCGVSERLPIEIHCVLTLYVLD